VSDRTVRAGLVHYHTSPVDVTAIAYCGDPPGTVHVRRETETFPGHDGPAPIDTVTATCHTGERLLFGGWAYPQDPGTDLYISRLQAKRSRKLVVGGFAFTNDVDVTASAYCSTKAPRLTTVSKERDLEPDTPASLRLTCPHGSQIAFGGLNSTITFAGGFVQLRGLERTGPREFKVTVRNASGDDPASVKAFAYCG
jgi:hypothetical protein